MGNRIAAIVNYEYLIVTAKQHPQLQQQKQAEAMLGQAQPQLRLRLTDFLNW